MRLKVLTVLALLTAIGLVLATQAEEGPEAPFIQGHGLAGRWSMEVHGASGIFVEDGEVWRIEFIFQHLGLNDFAHSLVFLGRKPENFLLLFLDINLVGDSFLAFRFNYKRASLAADQFAGRYDIRGIEPQPSFLEGYVPRGPVPNYIGRDFHIVSAHSNISPQGGTVTHEELGSLEVFPIYSGVIPSQWSEFWMIGIDHSTEHTYFLMYYDITPNTWIIDLWDGHVRNLPLGKAVVLEGRVTVQRDVHL
jgi:hypothetical protein